MLVFGNLYAIVLRAAEPNARYKTLIAFFAAGISSKSPIRLLSFVPVVFVRSVIEILFFAIGATSNKSSHFSYSNWGCFEASAQKLGSPAIACDPPLPVIHLPSFRLAAPCYSLGSLLIRN